MIFIAKIMEGDLEAEEEVREAKDVHPCPPPPPSKHLERKIDCVVAIFIF